jgi:hypothetical protein
LSPWCVIGIFLILILLSPFVVKGAFQADAAVNSVTGGATNELEKTHERKPKLRRLVEGILNFI